MWEAQCISGAPRVEWGARELGRARVRKKKRGVGYVRLPTVMVSDVESNQSLEPVTCCDRAREVRPSHRWRVPPPYSLSCRTEQF